MKRFLYVLLIVLLIAATFYNIAKGSYILALGDCILAFIICCIEPPPKRG
jgi:hypothetical protein